MEDLMARNPAAITMAAMSRDNFRQMTQVTCTVPVPLYSTTTPSSLPGYYDLDIRIDPILQNPDPEPMLAITDGNEEQNISNSNNSGTSGTLEEQDKLPSYIEAMESLKLKLTSRSKNTTTAVSSDPPPSYNEAVNIS